ncbi:hypothetical protein Hdeb2414_s0013g00416381 [Helianthus debilis subsp. tardiflorus]
MQAARGPRKATPLVNTGRDNSRSKHTRKPPRVDDSAHSNHPTIARGARELSLRPTRAARN